MRTRNAPPIAHVVTIQPTTLPDPEDEEACFLVNLLGPPPTFIADGGNDGSTLVGWLLDKPLSDRERVEWGKHIERVTPPGWRCSIGVSHLRHGPYASAELVNSTASRWAELP